MDMGVNGSCQNLRFHVTANRHIIGSALCVRDARHILLDDRALIKISRHINARLRQSASHRAHKPACKDLHP